MKVNVTQPCPNCKGLKKQVHPMWWTLFKRRNHEPDLTAAEFFLEEHGLVSSAERPSVIIPCQKCKGTGEVATWVPLKRFLELAHQAGLGLYKLLGGAPL